MKWFGGIVLVLWLTMFVSLFFGYSPDKFTIGVLILYVIIDILLVMFSKEDE